MKTEFFSKVKCETLFKKYNYSKFLFEIHSNTSHQTNNMLPFLLVLVCFETILSCKPRQEMFAVVTDLKIIPSTFWNQSWPSYSSFLQNTPQGLSFNFSSGLEEPQRMTLDLKSRKWIDPWGDSFRENEYDGSSIWQDGAVINAFVRKLGWGLRKGIR